MEAPTKDELEIARIILKHVDKDSLAVLTGDAARDLQPLVKLPAPVLAQIWSIVDPTGAGFLKFNEIVQFVRLIGYAQTNEPNISRSLLRKAGPVARIDGWTAPKGTSYDKPCDEPEKMLLEAIMREADPDGYGILDGDAAKTVLRRSGLPNGTLSEIWDLVDDTQKGFLQAGDLRRALRLISCAQRGLRLLVYIRSTSTKSTVSLLARIARATQLPITHIHLIQERTKRRTRKRTTLRVQNVCCACLNQEKSSCSLAGTW